MFGILGLCRARLYSARSCLGRSSLREISHWRPSARAQDQERSRSMPANRKHLRLVRIERADDFVVIGHRIDWLLIYFLNHITLLQLRSAGRRVHVSHNDTVNAVRKIELTGKRGGQVLDLNSAKS